MSTYIDRKRVGLVKALIYTEPGQLEYSDVEVPQPGPGEVLVRVRASGVCGSDINGYLGRSKRRIPPLILGHEFSAEVVGDADDQLPVGSRVAVFPLFGCGLVGCVGCASGHENRCEKRRLLGLDLPGALAEYVVVPRDACFPLNESVSDVAGALTEPLANAIHMYDTVLRRHGSLSRVAIIGGGGQGLMALLIGRHLGLECVMVEPDAHRRQAAADLGAAEVIDPRDESLLADFEKAAQARGFEAVIETAGYAETRRLAVKIAAAGGTVLYLGLHDGSSVADDLVIINREISVTGSYAYTRHDFQRASNLIASGQVCFDSFVTELPMANGVDVFQRLATAPGSLIKVVLTLGQEG